MVNLVARSKESLKVRLRNNEMAFLPTPCLCLVTSRNGLTEDTLVEKVLQGVIGGVNMVQVREKNLPGGHLLEFGARLRGAIKHPALLIFNERVDVALACGADGIQLAEDALPVSVTRHLVDHAVLIGKSVHSVESAVVAAEQGAEEFDVVPDFFALAEGNLEGFAEELASLCSLDLPVRVIMNTSNLSPQKLNLAIDAAIDAGVRGIQTGNGFGPSVTRSEIIRVKALTKDRCSIKAAGGIKNLPNAIELIEAGASHIGTSMGTELMQEFRRNEQK